MQKFRKGDEVVLIKHLGDSEFALEIGAVGVVEKDYGMRSDREDVNNVFVTWKIGFDKEVTNGTWWVHGNNIELYNVCLENK